MSGRELFEEASANWNTRLPWDRLSPETQEFWNKRAARIPSQTEKP